MTYSDNQNELGKVDGNVMAFLAQAELDSEDEKVCYVCEQHRKVSARGMCKKCEAEYILINDEMKGNY